MALWPCAGGDSTRTSSLIRLHDFLSLVGLSPALLHTLAACVYQLLHYHYCNKHPLGVQQHLLDVLLHPPGHSGKVAGHNRGPGSGGSGEAEVTSPWDHLAPDPHPYEQLHGVAAGCPYGQRA